MATGVKYTSFGDLWSKVWEDYKHHFGTYFKITLYLFFLPMLALLGIVSLLVGLLFGPLLSSSTSSDFVEPTFQFFTLTGNAIADNPLAIAGGIFFLFLFIALGIFILMTLLMICVMFLSAYSHVPTLTFGQVFSQSKRYFWSFIGLGLLVALFMMGLYASFIPLLYVFDYSIAAGIGVLFLWIALFIFLYFRYIISWSFAPMYILTEQKGVIESMKKSCALVQGRWWHVFGYYLLFGLVMMLVAFVVSMAMSVVMIPGAILFTVLLFVQPVVAIFLIGLLYLLMFSVQTTVIYPLLFLYVKHLYVDLRRTRQ